MASDDEDDFMSDKFLASLAPEPAAPKTYREIRKQANRKAEIKNLAGRTKSRRQLEEESIQEGLSKSLFERAKEEDAGVGNKALGMMMKMGFKVGEALGPKAAAVASPSLSPAPISGEKLSTPEPQPQADVPESTARPGLGAAPSHRTAPLPIHMWSGHKGIGSTKRPPSPTSLESIAKKAKVEEDGQKEDYRSRARWEFEERRVDGRLFAARKTCMTLDEKIEKEFNVYWLDPRSPAQFPLALMEYLTSSDSADTSLLESSNPGDPSWADALRRQMRVDALRSSPDPDALPLSFGPAQTREFHRALRGREEEGTAEKVQDVKEVELEEEQLVDAKRYLRLDARTRLAELLSYLRTIHHYCFWCGTQYSSADEMATECPGEEEDDHD